MDGRGKCRSVKYKMKVTRSTRMRLSGDQSEEIEEEIENETQFMQVWLPDTKRIHALPSRQSGTARQRLGRQLQTSSFDEWKEHDAGFLWLREWHTRLNQDLFTMSEVRRLDGGDRDRFDFVSQGGASVDTESAIGLRRGSRCGGQLVLDDVFQSTIPINTLLLRGLRHRLHALRRIVGREVNSSESGSIGTHQVHLHMFSAGNRRRTPLDGH